ncbi:MAG TPA: TetR/AcrR family transcriptional regulator [Thermoleophilia bacterium]|nr:TetR/AcrR family transcriptional regulator [Thermoleophilia bacterium]
MPRRLDDVRRAELLDGVMSIIAVRGFSDVRIAEIARELRCSAATLYKIAPSKDSLVLLAIARWGELTFADLEARAAEGETASERARAYFRAGAESLRPMSLAFYADIARFESTRLVWRTTVVDRYIDRFVALVQSAEVAGETRNVNTRLLGEVLRAIGFVTRDERVLRTSGLTSEQAVLEIDALLWDGLRTT